MDRSFRPRCAQLDQGDNRAGTSSRHDGAGDSLSSTAGDVRLHLLRLALETYRRDWFEALCACDAEGVAKAIAARKRIEAELATLEGSDGHDEDVGA